MPDDPRRIRLLKYLGHLQTGPKGQTEFDKVSKFLGQGPEKAEEQLRNLTPATNAPFRQSSLKAFLEYATLLAGTPEDVPNGVWSKRKKLLEKAIVLKIGQLG